jgi:hypothetical protein
MEKIKCTIERITYQNPENLILTVCAIIVPLKMAYFAHKTRRAKNNNLHTSLIFSYLRLENRLILILVE